MNGVGSDLAYLYKKAREIARASTTFLKEERRKFDRNLVEEKSARNYVSYVDKESERQIIEALSTLLPEAGFIAEEDSGSLTDEECCWIIDPLDSTSGYIHDIAPYHVSIALRNRKELLLGVVYEVCKDERFYAVKGGKTYLNGNEIHVSGVSVLDETFTALGFPYNSDTYRPIAGHLVDRLYGFTGGVRLMGSAVAELCYVAAERPDAHIEAFLDPQSVAASALILLQAGGKISDFNGGENQASGGQVVASNGKIHSLVLSSLP